MKKVILVAGHDFIKRGCYTIIDGVGRVDEYDLTTRIVTELFREEELKNLDVIVKGRNTYGNLPKEINGLNGDVIICCHYNAFDGKTQGTEVLYAASSTRGKVLAQKAQDILVKHLDFPSRGIKPVSTGERGAYVLTKTKAVAILPEPFFLDCIHDSGELEMTYRKGKAAMSELLKWIANNDF